MLNRHNLNIARLAAKDESRYMVTGVRVSPSETIATDGRQLTRVTTPKFKADDFPVKDGFKPTTTFEPFILPAQSALAIAKALPKKSTLPILLNAAIGEHRGGHPRVFHSNRQTRGLKRRGFFQHHDSLDAVT